MKPLKAQLLVCIVPRTWNRLHSFTWINSGLSQSKQPLGVLFSSTATESQVAEASHPFDSPKGMNENSGKYWGIGRNKSGRPAKKEGLFTRILYLLGHFHHRNLMSVVSMTVTNSPEKLQVMLSHVCILHRKRFLPLSQDKLHSRNIHKSPQHSHNAHEGTAHCKARSSPLMGENINFTLLSWFSLWYWKGAPQISACCNVQSLWLHGAAGGKLQFWKQPFSKSHSGVMAWRTLALSQGTFVRAQPFTGRF